MAAGITITAIPWVHTTEVEVGTSRIISIKGTASSIIVSSPLISRDVRASRIINNSHMVEATKDIIRITTMMMVGSTINMSIKMEQRYTVQLLNMEMLRRVRMNYLLQKSIRMKQCKKPWINRSPKLRTDTFKRKTCSKIKSIKLFRKRP